MTRRLPIVSCDTDAVPEARVDDPIPLAARGTVGVPGWLADRQGRRLRYLRLSVTDRCDLRCRYCMPESGISASDREDVLGFEEAVRIVRVFRSLGVETVRLTGGEPLVRRSLTELVRMLRDDAGIEDLALTTNATALPTHAHALVAAGLKRVNVSLDSVDPEVFARMTRGGRLDRVVAGIDAIQAAGIRELKVNTVVVRGLNDHLLVPLVEWAWARNITPRFIELMPLGEGAKLGSRAVVTVKEIKERLAGLIDVEAASEARLDRGPASYVPAAEKPAHRVGFIGAVTENFCHRCNRVRITARGEIRACLASPDGLSLRDALREGLTDEELLERIDEALFGKRDGHAFNQEGVTRHFDVHMSRVGG